MKNSYSSVLFVLSLVLMIAGCVVHTRGNVITTSLPIARVYYPEPVFYPGYRFSNFYLLPPQPRVIIFFGNDGKHHRHKFDGRKRGRGFGGRGRR